MIAMLALGIGANVAVFSVINGLFLRPFPVPDPERLVYINEAAPRWSLDMTSVNYADFWQWHQDQRLFEAIALYDTVTQNIATDAGADRIDGASVDGRLRQGHRRAAAARAALLANVIPARRAARVDPMVSLRTD